MLLKTLWSITVLFPKLAATLVCALVYSRAEASEDPIIDAIEGDKIVVVKTAQGNRVAGRGTIIHFGDRIKTGPRATARILYPDGSKLVVGKGSEVEILQAENGTQWNELHSGELRGIIKKPRELKIGVPPHFAIKSKSVVMGVRGTDFSFNSEASSGASEVRTLEGSVQVAKDEEALLRGEGKFIEKGQLVHADEKGIGAVEAFDAERYIEEKRIREPDFIRLGKEGPDAAAGAKITPPAAETAHGSSRIALHLWNFRLSGLYSQEQLSRGSVMSGEASFDPHFQLLGFLTAGLHLGAFPLKFRNDPTASGIPLGVTAAIEVSVLISRLILESALGIEQWNGGRSNGPGPVATGNLGFKLSDTELLERVFIGASYFSPSSTDDSVVQLRAGIGVRF